MMDLRFLRVTSSIQEIFVIFSVRHRTEPAVCEGLETLRSNKFLACGVEFLLRYTESPCH